MRLRERLIEPTRSYCAASSFRVIAATDASFAAG
jgi:hypothetical protein